MRHKKHGKSKGQEPECDHQTRIVFSQYSHYSLLATVEAIFNLGTLGRTDTSDTPMSDLFRGGIP